MDRVVHCQDWAPVALDEYSLVLFLCTAEAETESGMLVPDSNHVLWSGMLIVLVGWQYLLNLWHSHAVSHLLLLLHLTRHFLTKRWCWER